MLIDTNRRSFEQIILILLTLIKQTVKLIAFGLLYVYKKCTFLQNF
jgi:hypothetical protein